MKGTVKKRLEEAREALNLAEAELAAAQREIDEAFRQDYQDRLAERAAATLTADRSTFYAGDEQTFDERPYILPFGRGYSKWNPWDVENHEFGKHWLAGMTAIICKRQDEERSFPTRLVWTSGGPSKSDRIGNAFLARHDQTGAKLGVYEIVGLVMYDQKGDVLRVEGDVPDRKYSQSTYK